MRARGDAELFVDFLAVTFHRAFGDIQPVGDLLGTWPFGNQGDDLTLPRAEREIIGKALRAASWRILRQPRSAGLASAGCRTDLT